MALWSLQTSQFCSQDKDNHLICTVNFDIWRLPEDAFSQTPQPTQGVKHSDPAGAEQAVVSVKSPDGSICPRELTRMDRNLTMSVTIMDYSYKAEFLKIVYLLASRDTEDGVRFTSAVGILACWHGDPWSSCFALQGQMCLWQLCFGRVNKLLWCLD